MAIITEFNKWYLSCDSYTTPQILASCIKAALGNDAHFWPLTKKEGILLFQQPQELEGVITPYSNNYWRRNLSCDQLCGVYCYELNSMKPIVYRYDAGIQDNKEGG